MLAAISAVAATNNVGWRAIVLTIAYAVGAAIPMLLIALGGQKAATRLRIQGPRLRIASGIVIGVVALGIALNWDTRFQTALPGYTQALQKHIEETNTAKKALANVHPTKTLTAKGPSTDGLPDYGPAPALHPDGDWFNSKPLTLASLRGKVVLVDFWTYSCINCLRTLPHLKAWYAAYHRDGLEIIGVHTPEFAFEHVASNVGAAVKRLGIKYPVVQDNDYGTWDAYGNEYWPADYLIDRQGRIRDYDFGEGNYAETEAAIRTLLGNVHGGMTDVPNLTPTDFTTPESYLGYARLARYVGSLLHRNKLASYTFPASIPADSLAYSGNWTLQSQRIVAGKNAQLRLNFDADDVYIVLGGRGKVTASVNGRPTAPIDVNAYRLYTVHSSKHEESGLLQLGFTPGVQAYSFTFG